MILDVAQGMALLIISIMATLVLLGILVIVHKQTAKVKELEMRMKAMESVGATEVKTEGESTNG
mgnify:CR=1 FL=1